jgi:hypothetical protein
MHAARSTRRFTLLSAAALLAACGSEVQTPAPVATAGPVQLAGTYEVRGSTRVVGASETREIEGTVILAQEGDAYTATFNLQTLYPSEGGPVTAEVIGRGDGTIAGRSLEGSARTQILASRVQGLDPKFTLVPPAFSVRIVSSTRGEIKPDGRLSIEIESKGAEGEREYVPTHTTLHGRRIAAQADRPSASR